MWASVLMSATLALIALPSAVDVLPVSGHTSLALASINITGPALEPPREFVNLKYIPWPQAPYYVPLHVHGPFLDQYLAIGKVWKIHTSPPINSLELQRFVLDFANNINEHDPVPGLVPPYASQSTIDVVSYTKWTIRFYQAPTMGRVPIVLVLAALHQLGLQLYSHGPAQMVWCITDMEAGWIPWAYGELRLEPIMGSIANRSSLNGNGGFQTA